jgi:hypothetical protein
MTGLAFLLQTLAYLIKGLLGKNFGEHGINTSGERRDGFYIWLIVLYLSWTVSSLLLAFLVHAALFKANENTDVLICGLLESRILFGMLALSFLSIITGCVWNLLTLWNTGIVDSTNEKISTRILKYGQLFWHGFYCAFLITTAYVWGAVAKQSQIMIGNLSPSFTTSAIVAAQVMIACILIVYAIDIANNNDIRGPHSSQEYTYAELIFNYCMLISGHFIQANLLALFRLSVDNVKEEASTEDGSSEHGEGPEVGKDDFVDDVSKSFEQMENQGLIKEDSNKMDLKQDIARAAESAEVLPSCMTHGKVLTYFVMGTTTSVSDF